MLFSVSDFKSSFPISTLSLFIILSKNIYYIKIKINIYFITIYNNCIINIIIIKALNVNINLVFNLPGIVEVNISKLLKHSLKLLALLISSISLDTKILKFQMNTVNK